MNKNEIHAYFDEVLDEAYARGNRDGYQQGRSDGYQSGRASVILPHPCDGPLYDDWHWPQYLDKMREEFEEVLEAVDSVRDCTKKHLGMNVLRERRDHLMRECTDLIVATTTFMDQAGYRESDRQRFLYEVNESNARRDDGRRFKKHPFDEPQEQIYKGNPFSASGAEAEQSNKERFKDGDKVKIIIPESEIRGELDARKVDDMIITNNSIGRVIYYDTSLDTYALEATGRIVSVPSEWLERVEEQ